MAARKKAAAASKDGGDDKKTATQMAGQISAKKLKVLMADGRAVVQKTREISGEYGATVKDAVENENLHKGAFAIIRKLDRMEPEKLADFLDVLGYYLDISGLNDRAAKVMKMDLNDDGMSGKGGKVHPFPTPKGEAAE